MRPLALGVIESVQIISKTEVVVMTRRAGLVYISTNPLHAERFSYACGDFKTGKINPASWRALLRFIGAEGITKLYHLT